jgi:hypothetical protein
MFNVGGRDVFCVLITQKEVNFILEINIFRSACDN